MTVCIATKCQWTPTGEVAQTLIVGAADRMKTYGDMEYEPEQTKIFQFTSHTAALTSGDTAAQLSVCQATQARTSYLPNLTVATVAVTYAEEFANFRRNRNERRILAPLGLNTFTLLNRQQGMSSEQADRLISLMVTTDLGDEVIVTGWDASGAHVYVIADPGEAVCLDSIGWGAVGSGRWHAESLFMVEGYTPYWQFEQALHLTYQAKKRADVAPGVGSKYTDLFLISTGGFHFIAEDSPLFKAIDHVYQETRQQEQEARDKGRANIVKYIAEELANAEKQGTGTAVTAPESPKQANEGAANASEGV